MSYDEYMLRAFQDELIKIANATIEVPGIISSLGSGIKSLGASAIKHRGTLATLGAGAGLLALGQDTAKKYQAGAQMYASQGD